MDEMKEFEGMFNSHVEQKAKETGKLKKIL
jgi:hypothetical protein